MGEMANKSSAKAVLISGFALLCGGIAAVLPTISWESLSRQGMFDFLPEFSTVLMSIIIEAIPFVLIGALISSIIQLFVSEELIQQIIPKNHWVSLAVAGCMGFIFPVCECAIVPIMRGFIKKGVPLHFAVTFMLAVPIVNPVVLASTYYSFSGVQMVLLRGGLGWIGAILVGHLVGALMGEGPVLRSTEMKEHSCGRGDEDHGSQGQACHCGHRHDHGGQKEGFLLKMLALFRHTSMELYQVGRFLIVGAILSALLQTFVSRSILVSVGQNPASSVLVMMALAFTLSLCSEADAFIARTFANQFTMGSIVGFLIFGPMMDIKNALMLSGSFRGRFVILLIALIVFICFDLAMTVNWVSTLWG